MKIPARRSQLALLFSLLVLSGFTGYAHWARKALETTLSKSVKPFRQPLAPPAKPSGQAATAKIIKQPNRAKTETFIKAAPAPAQAGVSLPAAVFAGGGGKSAESRIDVTGTIGQGVLGASSINSLSLSGGFWGGSQTINTVAVASVSAASFAGATLASESIVAAFGVKLATDVVVASTIPLPTSLAGTMLKVKDSAGAERLAPLFFVSPGQINYLMPPGTASGTATVTVNSSDGTLSAGSVQITAVAPGLFTANANGQGVPAAVLFRVSGNGSQSVEAISRFDGTGFVPLPLDLGPATDQVFLILFGTGFRFNSGLSAVPCTIGGVNAEVSFASAQGDLVGLDQANVRIPRSLIGRGIVNVILTVNGAVANTVQINIK